MLHLHLSRLQHLSRHAVQYLYRVVSSVLHPRLLLHDVPNAATAAAEAATRKDLAATYRILDKLGLNEGVCNHLTALIPGSTDQFLVIRYGLDWSEVTPENLVLVDTSGKILKGEGPIEVTAFEIHRAIHLADPDKYACVLHTHMPCALLIAAVQRPFPRLDTALITLALLAADTTALCCIGSESATESIDAREGWPGLVMCHQNSARFYDDIAYDSSFNGLVTDKNEGTRIANAMGGKRVLLHRNHGVIVCNSSVAAAFDDIYYLERAAEIQVLAMSTGRPLVEMRPEVAASTKV